MRLIDLDDVRHTYCGDSGEYERWNIDPNLLVDAVPVIPCKDCKWWNTDEDECWLSGLDTDGYEYCSWAERKDDETD